MLRVVSLACVMLALASTSAPAQGPPPLPLPNPFEGTPREQAACRPDSVRYCKELIANVVAPDTFRILACLQAHRTRLSHACREVLESHGQ